MNEKNDTIQQTYDLTRRWYTTPSKNHIEIEKFLLILNSLKINTQNYSPSELASKKWIGLSTSKSLHYWSAAITEQDFKEANYQYIPFKYLLTL